MGEFNLGLFYEHGEGGLKKDSAQAVALVRKAASQGLAIAQSELGYLYESGDVSGRKDDLQAAAWYAKAASQGDPMGEFDLGNFYKEGRGGLPKNLPKAEALYRQAAAQGNHFADEALAAIAANRTSYRSSSSGSTYSSSTPRSSLFPSPSQQYNLNRLHAPGNTCSASAAAGCN